MPRTRDCDFCETDIEPGTGTMFVRTDGTTIHFCSSKCEKNADLGREARDLEWTGEDETEAEEEAEPETEEQAGDESEEADADSDASEEDADSEETDADSEETDESDNEDKETEAEA